MLCFWPLLDLHDGSASFEAARFRETLSIECSCLKEIDEAYGSVFSAREFYQNVTPSELDLIWLAHYFGCWIWMISSLGPLSIKNRTNAPGSVDKLNLSYHWRRFVWFEQHRQWNIPQRQYNSLKFSLSPDRAWILIEHNISQVE